MGGIIRTVFGGSKSKSSSTQQATSTSESGNRGFDYLREAFGGNVGIGNSAMAQLSALLGLGGDQEAAEKGFNNYLGSTGQKFMLDQGSKAITNNAAAKGLLNSGSTGKALTTFGQEKGKEGFGNYLAQLLSLVSGGLQSGGLIGGAGGYSNSSSQSTGSSKGSTIDSGKGIFAQLFPGGIGIPGGG